MLKTTNYKVNPVKSILELFPGKEATKTSSLIEFLCKYSHFRSFSKDGNSFYSAFLYGYLETLITKSPSHIEQFIGLMSDQKSYTFFEGLCKKDFKTTIKNPLLEINTILASLGNEKALKCLLKIIRATSALTNLNLLLRSGLADFLKWNSELEINGITVDQIIESLAEFTQNIILKNGIEAPQLIWSTIPLLMRIQIHIFILQEIDKNDVPKAYIFPAILDDYAIKKNDLLDLHSERICMLFDHTFNHFYLLYPATTIYQFPEITLYDKDESFYNKEEVKEIVAEKQKCALCGQILPALKNLSMRISCPSKHEYHIACIKNFFRGLPLNTPNIKLECPNPKCPNFLNPNEIGIVRNIVEEEKLMEVDSIICAKCQKTISLSRLYLQLNCKHAICNNCIKEDKLLIQYKYCPNITCNYALSVKERQSIQDLGQNIERPNRYIPDRPKSPQKCELCELPIDIKGCLTLERCGHSYHFSCLITKSPNITSICPSKKCYVTMHVKDIKLIHEITGILPTGNGYSPPEDIKIHFKYPIISPRFEPPHISNIFDTTCPIFNRCLSYFKTQLPNVSSLLESTHMCYCKTCYKGPWTYQLENGEFNQLPIGGCRLGVRPHLWNIGGKKLESICMNWENGYISLHQKLLKSIFNRGTLSMIAPPEFDGLQFKYAKTNLYSSCSPKFIVNLNPNVITYKQRNYYLGLQLKLMPNSYSRYKLGHRKKGKKLDVLKTKDEGSIMVVGIIIFEDQQMDYSKQWVDLRDSLYKGVTQF